MSPTKPTILDPDTAYATVHNRVYAPVFFEKLASDYNLRPSTDEEAVQMLEMAAKLRMAHDTAEKQAAARYNPLAAAEAHLNNKLTKLGFAVPQHSAVDPRRVKAASVQASFDPELAHAVMSMQAVASGLTAEQLTAA